jgi:hypothetical protein
MLTALSCDDDAHERGRKRRRRASTDLSVLRRHGSPRRDLERHRLWLRVREPRLRCLRRRRRVLAGHRSREVTRPRSGVSGHPAFRETLRRSETRRIVDGRTRRVGYRVLDPAGRRSARWRPAAVTKYPTLGRGAAAGRARPAPRPCDATPTRGKRRRSARFDAPGESHRTRRRSAPWSPR